MTEKMTEIIIETNDNENKKRELSYAPLTEIEKLFEKEINIYLKDFRCDKKFFGFYRSYYWEKSPKLSMRMVLFNFDGKHATNFMQSIFGDEPVPDFILRNKKLSNMLCHAVCCDSYFSKQDFDADMELRERMLEKFDV